jgi:hypothetical protein
VMTMVKRVAEMKAPHAGLERSRELEEKVALWRHSSQPPMSTNRELKFKFDEISVELDIARKVDVRLTVTVAEMGAVTVAEMGAPINHFSNVANYTHLSEDTQAHALASTYRLDYRFRDVQTCYRGVSFLYNIHFIYSFGSYPNC